jgi:hypothetical protein
MTLRFFAGYDFTGKALEATDWLEKAYRGGVPMGGDLAADGKGRAPVFLVMAAKEPDGANLDRIQIIKGWVRNGTTMEKIYNVALADKRKPDASGSIAPIGNTVDAKNASYSNSIGDSQLSVVWRDPDFDPEVSAVYYARVLQIPTPRWSTYDAKTLGIAPRDDLPVAIQERAWSSPIWYTP